MSEQTNKVWIKTTPDKLNSLIADEAKNAGILDELYTTIKQLRAKSAFRLALLHSLREEYTTNEKGNNK